MYIFEPLLSEAQLVKSKILSTIFFTGGICTIIQILIGSRLPIMQGGSFAFIAPVFGKGYIIQLGKVKKLVHPNNFLKF